MEGVQKNFAHQPGIGDRLFQIHPCQVKIRSRRARSLRLAISNATRSHPALVARLLGDIGQQIANVDHALRIIQRLIINRHAGAPGFLKEDQSFADGHILVETVDIHAWDHDIFDPNLPETQDIVQHSPLFGRKGGTDFGVVHQRVGQILAQALAL